MRTSLSGSLNTARLNLGSLNIGVGVLLPGLCVDRNFLARDDPLDHAGKALVEPPQEIDRIPVFADLGGLASA
jgi:hypothetical protein